MHFVIRIDEESESSKALQEGDAQNMSEVLRLLTKRVTQDSEKLASCHNAVIEVDGSSAKDFFSKVAASNELWPDLAEFVKAVTQLGDERRVSGGDCEAFGHEAASVLATTEEAHLPVVIDWIRTLDLEGESGIVELIDSVIATHGVSPETLDLLAHRMTDCDGQHGESQAIEIWENNPGFAELLEPAETYKAFIDRLVDLAVPIELGINPSDSFEDYKEEFFDEDTEVTYYEMLVDILDAMYKDNRSRYGILKNRLRSRFLKEIEKTIEGDPDSLELLPTKIDPAALKICVSAEKGIVINETCVPYNPSLEFLEELLGPSRVAEDRTYYRHVWDSLGIELQPDDDRCDHLDGNLMIRFAPDPLAKRLERALLPYSGTLVIQGLEVDCGKMTVNQILKRMDPPLPRPHCSGPNCNWILDLPNMQVHYWMKGETPRSRVIAVGFGAPGSVKIITD